MKCDRCHKAEAVLQWTQVVDGVVRSVHLCEECARKSGVNLDDPMSAMPNPLFDLGQPSAISHEAPAGAGRACPECHTTFAQFRKSGRLGCPGCYAAFAEELDPLLKQMHPGDHHVGRVPPDGRAAAETTARDLERLHEELSRAVAEERYEDAAKIRDRIAAMRGTAGAPREPGTS